MKNQKVEKKKETEPIERVKPTKRQRDFFKFQGNKFTKLARSYHHELLHLTEDLIRVNQRIQEAASLCHQQIGFIKKKNSSHLISSTGYIHFENALYHLENFTFRVTCYRDKLVQFINQALRIGFDEKTMGVIGAIVGNRIVRDAHLNTELKRFEKDKDFRDSLSERILLTHRRYYETETGYDHLMRPDGEFKDRKEMLKLWKRNIEAKTSRADRIVVKTMVMNDRVMRKINLYSKKHPIR